MKSDILKVLLQSHADGDEPSFRKAALQLAAAESTAGNVRVAEEIRSMIAKMPPARLRKQGPVIDIASPRGDLADILEGGHRDERLRDNANNIVTSATGNASLTDGSTTGTGYVVDDGTLAATPTFGQLDAAYNAGTETAIAGANPTIAASAFHLVGADLDVTNVRTLIIRRVTSGVAAYQAFKVTVPFETQVSAMTLDVVENGWGPLERNRATAATR